jgi:hypothetical protein
MAKCPCGTWSARRAWSMIIQFTLARLVHLALGNLGDVEFSVDWELQVFRFFRLTRVFTKIPLGC